MQEEHEVTGYAVAQEEAKHCILIGVDQGRSATESAELEASLAELEELCEACGLAVLAKAVQAREKPDTSFYVGRGKLEEVCELAEHLGAEALVFEAALSPSQMRRISEMTELFVYDRNLIILDIFAKRAKSSEGVLQVEIAQLQDRLTRLGGEGIHLSRLGGGIGTRGPGETKLETDRRSIRRRISHLKGKLAELADRRDHQRQRRKQRKALSFAVCGYTNVGKSSLVNRLCQSDLEAYDQVFATLDPTARRLELPGPEILLCDTVGFVRNLPHHLVEAFKSSLDELRVADVIIQVTDASDPNWEESVALMEEIFRDLEVADRPRIHVFNKMDLVPEQFAIKRLERSRAMAGVPEVKISVRTGQGIPELLEVIQAEVEAMMPLAERRIPFDAFHLLNDIQEKGVVEAITYDGEGARCRFRLMASALAQIDAQLAQMKE